MRRTAAHGKRPRPAPVSRMRLAWIRCLAR